MNRKKTKWLCNGGISNGSFSLLTQKFIYSSIRTVGQFVDQVVCQSMRSYSPKFSL